MRSSILMIYPNTGFSGAFVIHTPLGLLYSTSEIVKAGMEVKIFDTRLCPGSWRHELKKLLTKDVLVAGISVMSGQPIQSAVQIGRYIKSIDHEIQVVWGGPHATLYPDTILNQEWSCDYVVSGYAKKSFFELIQLMINQQEPSSVKGISYRKGNSIITIPRIDTKFEYINFRDIPYHLIEDYSVYGQLDQEKKIFSIFSAMGCPYKCSFCSSPAEYSRIQGPKWVPLYINDIVDHIEYLVNEHQANYIYFIDDDSFVDLVHCESIIDEIKRRKIEVGLGFRGARINEIKKMSHSFLDKLASAGTDILHIGAESGSDRVLKMIRKNCTVTDIIECNVKLSQHPQITAAYNFIVGLPNETLDDIKATRDLMIRLVKDNPRCIVFQPNKYRPIPGTELFNIVNEKWGYEPPKTLQDWTNIEAEGNFSAPWYPPNMKKVCDMLLVCSYFVDNKIAKMTSGRTIFYKLMKLINIIYRPIALFRLKHFAYQFLFEYEIYKILTKLIKNVVSKAR